MVLLERNQIHLMSLGLLLEKAVLWNPPHLLAPFLSYPLFCPDRSAPLLLTSGLHVARPDVCVYPVDVDLEQRMLP